MSLWHIDFARPSLEREWRRAPWAAWWGCACGVALCGAAAFGFQQYAQSQAAAQAEQSAVQRRIDALSVRREAKPPASVTPTQANLANASISQLNTPWQALWDGMEAASLGTVALLELSADPKNHRFLGVAEARQSDAMLAYIRQLKAQAVFDDAWLTKHDTAEQDPAQPIRFEFAVNWRRAK